VHSECSRSIVGAASAGGYMALLLLLVVLERHLRSSTGAAVRTPELLVFLLADLAILRSGSRSSGSESGIAHGRSGRELRSSLGGAPDVGGDPPLANLPPCNSPDPSPPGAPQEPACSPNPYLLKELAEDGVPYPEASREALVEVPHKQPFQDLGSRCSASFFLLQKGSDLIQHPRVCGHQPLPLLLPDADPELIPTSPLHQLEQHHQH
jgi:hypothetical protein